MSKCYGSCAAYWPPVTGTAAAGPGVPGKIGTIRRTDGALQLTYDGHPLYTYIGDYRSRPGHRQQHQPERRTLARGARLPVTKNQNLCIERTLDSTPTARPAMTAGRPASSRVPRGRLSRPARRPGTREACYSSMAPPVRRRCCRKV